MFTDIGSKCKRVAKILCYTGIICSILSGLVMMLFGILSTNGGGGLVALYGILVMLFGSAFSWIGSIGLYAVGETAENSAIAANLAIKADMEREQQSNTVLK